MRAALSRGLVSPLHVGEQLEVPSPVVRHPLDVVVDGHGGGLEVVVALVAEGHFDDLSFTQHPVEFTSVGTVVKVGTFFAVNESEDVVLKVPCYFGWDLLLQDLEVVADTTFVFLGISFDVVPFKGSSIDGSVFGVFIVDTNPPNLLVALVPEISINLEITTIHHLTGHKSEVNLVPLDIQVELASIGREFRDPGTSTPGLGPPPAVAPVAGVVEDQVPTVLQGQGVAVLAVVGVALPDDLSVPVVQDHVSVVLG